MRLLFEAEAAQNSAVHGKSVHGIIRLHKHLILLRSLHYDYYRFPGGEIMPDETPEQALIRTVQAETGLTVLPESIRECGAVREVCSENGEKVTVREHCYYDCEVSEKKLPHDKSTDRFLPMPVLLPDALTLNRSEKHGAVSGEAAFQTMLRRETGVLLSLLALTCSVTALGIRLIFRRSKYIGIAAVAVAWTAFGYAALITVPWLAVIIPEWIRRMISI